MAEVLMSTSSEIGGGGGGEATGDCVFCVWWRRLLGDCGGEEKLGEEGERCPKSNGGGSTLAVEVVTLMSTIGCWGKSFLGDEQQVAQSDWEMWNLNKWMNRQTMDSRGS